MQRAAFELVSPLVEPVSDQMFGGKLLCADTKQISFREMDVALLQKFSDTWLTFITSLMCINSIVQKCHLMLFEYFHCFFMVVEYFVWAPIDSPPTEESLDSLQWAPPSPWPLRSAVKSN